MKIYCKNKHWNIIENYNINKILYLLVDRPTYINTYNDIVWRNNKKEVHRDYDLPAFIQNDGFVCWYKNNNLYIDNNKPTRIWGDGSKEYLISIQ